MKAVLRKTLADLRRRRLQSVVVALVVLLASGTATLALTLLFSTSDPYNQAFAQQRGARLDDGLGGRALAAVEQRVHARRRDEAGAAR